MTVDVTFRCVARNSEGEVVRAAPLRVRTDGALSGGWGVVAQPGAQVAGWGATAKVRGFIVGGEQGGGGVAG